MRSSTRWSCGWRRVEGHVAATKEQLGDVQSSVTYLGHKAGEHERDIYVLKNKRVAHGCKAAGVPLLGLWS